MVLRSSNLSPWAGLVLLVFPSVALAGMPSVHLSDLARLRVEAISFFGFGVLVCAKVIQFLWNRLRTDFAFLPRLTYGKALGVVVLWGLLFVLVLTMISGARELMTPGAWQKQGWTYRLADKRSATPTKTVENSPSSDMARRQRLEGLRDGLWAYAQLHEGHFPANQADTGVAAERWLLGDGSRMRYRYQGGLSAGQGDKLLAYEPEVYEHGRLALFTSGAIRLLSEEQLAQRVGGKKP